MRYRNTRTGRIVDLAPEEAKAAGIPSPHRPPARGPRWVPVDDEPQGDTTGDDGDDQADGDKTAPRPAEVRAWAREQGIDVPARGKVPPEIIERYLEAREESAEG